MLHGEIKINDFRIVEFEITNLQQGGEDYQLYGVVVNGRDNRGYPYFFEFDMEYFGTGPGLVAKVMTEVDRRLTE